MVRAVPASTAATAFSQNSRNGSAPFGDEELKQRGFVHVLFGIAGVEFRHEIHAARRCSIERSQPALGQCPLAGRLRVGEFAYRPHERRVRVHQWKPVLAVCRAEGPVFHWRVKRQASLLEVTGVFEPGDRFACRHGFTSLKRAATQPAPVR